MLLFVLLLEELFDLFEELRGKHEIVERLVGASVNCVVVSFPVAVSFIDKHDIFSDSEHGVHVVGVDDGGDVIFMGDVAQQVIDQNRRLRVESGVGFVAEKIFGIERDSAGDSHTFLHTARYFGRIFIVAFSSPTRFMQK